MANNGKDSAQIEFVTRDEFLKLDGEFREWRAIVNTKLDRFEKLESDIDKMQETLTRIDERQLQMQQAMILQNKHNTDTMNAQFKQLASAIDRIVDHLIVQKKEAKG